MCGNRLGVTCISNTMTVKRLDDVTSKWHLAEKAMGTRKRPLDMVTFRIQMENSYCKDDGGRAGRKAKSKDVRSLWPWRLQGGRRKLG